MLSLFAAAVAGDEGSCSTLAGNSGSLALNGTVLTNSTWIPAGAKNVSGTFNAAAFCEVFGTVSYTNDDYVVFEVWLPEETAYNGRFLAVGGFPSHYELNCQAYSLQEMAAWREQSTKLHSLKI